MIELSESLVIRLILIILAEILHSAKDLKPLKEKGLTLWVLFCLWSYSLFEAFKAQDQGLRWCNVTVMIIKSARIQKNHP